jgi:hypothetical protein
VLGLDDDAPCAVQFEGKKWSAGRISRQSGFLMASHVLGEIWCLTKSGKYDRVIEVDVVVTGCRTDL